MRRLRWYLGTAGVAGIVTIAYCVYLFYVPQDRRIKPTILVGSTITVISAFALTWIFRSARPKSGFWGIVGIIIGLHALPVAIFAIFNPPALLFPALVATAWFIVFSIAPVLLHPSREERHQFTASARRVFGGSPRKR